MSNTSQAKRAAPLSANTALVVDVLSDSTEAFDRGEKFAYYRKLASLQDYVLVSQYARLIERFVRNDEPELDAHDLE
jgi:Uma2 family endonuclease